MRRRQVYAARAAAERAASVPQQPEAAPMFVMHPDDPLVAFLPQGAPVVLQRHVVGFDGEPVIPARKKPGPKPGSKRKH